MKFLNTPEEKKSFGITAIIFMVLFLLFAFLGLTYMDPPPENGVAINFGTSDTGSGEIQPMGPPKSVQSEPQNQPKPVEDNTLTQDSDSPVAVSKTEKKKPTEKPVDKPTETKPVEPPKRKVNSALDRIKNAKNSEGNSSASHGDDAEGNGDKGKINGSLYANSFYGRGSGDGIGTGKGTGWGLAGRKLAGNNKKVQECNEAGKVVVKIWVNKQGNVIKAERAQGTTNSDSCLVNPAIATAKTFKWQADENAPDTQIGFVVVNFQLGE
jgi:protein TonB